MEGEPRDRVGKARRIDHECPVPVALQKQGLEARASGHRGAERPCDPLPLVEDDVDGTDDAGRGVGIGEYGNRDPVSDEAFAGPMEGYGLLAPGAHGARHGFPYLRPDRSAPDARDGNQCRVGDDDDRIVVCTDHRFDAPLEPLSRVCAPSRCGTRVEREQRLRIRGQ